MRKQVGVGLVKQVSTMIPLKDHQLLSKHAKSLNISLNQLILQWIEPLIRRAIEFGNECESPVPENYAKRSTHGLRTSQKHRR